MIAAIVEGVMQAIEEGDHKTSLATMCQQRSRQKQHKGKQIYCIQENSLFWKKRALGDVQTHETLFSKLAVYELCYIYTWATLQVRVQHDTKQDKTNLKQLFYDTVAILHSAIAFLLCSCIL